MSQSGEATINQLNAQSNGQAVQSRSTRRVREKQPILLENILDEERAKRFSVPVTWEILKDVTGETSDVVHQGMIDYDNFDDRSALGELASYCFQNRYLLLTYVAE